MSGKSNAAMKRLAALDESMEVIDAQGGEEQSNVLLLNRTIETRNLDLLRTALDGEGMSENDLQFAAKQQTLIMTSSARTIMESISIGRNLIELKQRLTRRAFERFFDEQKGKLLPFGMIYARKLILIAEDLPRLQDHLGSSFELSKLPSTAVLYELSVLPDEMLVTACDRGLLAPETTVKMIRAFKTEITIEKVQAKPISATSVRALRKAKDRLAVLRDRVREQEEIIKQLETAE